MTVDGNPYNIVQYAVWDSKGNSLPGDEVWCVFDVEAPKSHPKIIEAMELAAQYEISCAISNPCFEVWPLLHVVDHRAYLATSHEACRLLAKVLPGYTTRRKTVDYQILKPDYPRAKSRAMALESSYDESVRPKDRNPSTSVWRLMDALDAMYRRR